MPFDAPIELILWYTKFPNNTVNYWCFEIDKKNNSWKFVHEKAALARHDHYLTSPTKYQNIEVE